MFITQRQQPEKIYDRAQIFTKTFTQQFQQPASNSKKQQIKQFAQNQKKTIKIAIEQAQIQKDLYRNLQKIDIRQRIKIAKTIQQKKQKVYKNLETLTDKQNKQAQKYNLHLQQVYDKFKDDDLKKKNKQTDAAIKLRKQLVNFYEKQRIRRLRASNAQTKVSTCYQNSVDRMQQIHRKNVEFSERVDLQLSIQLNRNNHHYEIIRSRVKTTTFANRKKLKIYENRNQKLDKKMRIYTQEYCEDMNQSQKAFNHKNEENDKNKKRISQFFQRRYQKWHEYKKRIDEQKSLIPQKCSDILQKANKSSYRKTTTSFRSIFQDRTNRIQLNRSQIKYKDDKKRSSIIKNHNDMRIKNTATLKINEKMESMRRHAKKLASHYL